MSLPDVTLALFTFFNTFRLFSYVPQIVRLEKDDTGAAAIAFSTWVIWIGANASTTAYAVVNLGDTKLAFINGINTLCCCIVCGLAAWKRHRRPARTGIANGPAPVQKAA